MEAELAVEAKEGAEHTVEEAGSNGKPRFTTSPVSNAESSPELGRAPLILRPLDDGPNLDGDLTGPPSSYSSPSNSPVGPELHFTYIDSIGESAFLLALPTLLVLLALPALSVQTIVPITTSTKKAPTCCRGSRGGGNPAPATERSR